jgi:hypothetical protein
LRELPGHRQMIQRLGLPQSNADLQLLHPPGQGVDDLMLDAERLHPTGSAFLQLLHGELFHFLLLDRKRRPALQTEFSIEPRTHGPTADLPPVCRHPLHPRCS